MTLIVLVYVKNIITVTKIVQGVEAKNLPKDYKVTVELAKVNGNQKKLVTLSDFKEIEKVNANDAGGLFASGTIQASELGLQDGDRYTVVEKVDRTFNGKDNNRYALVQITDSINETINNLPVNAKQQFEYSLVQAELIIKEVSQIQRQSPIFISRHVRLKLQRK